LLFHPVLHHRNADRSALLGHLLGNLPGREVGPEHVLPARISGRADAQNRFQIFFELWVCGDLFFGQPPDAAPALRQGRWATGRVRRLPARWSAPNTPRLRPRTGSHHAPTVRLPTRQTVVDPSPTTSRKTPASLLRSAARPAYASGGHHRAADGRRSGPPDPQSTTPEPEYMVVYRLLNVPPEIIRPRRTWSTPPLANCSDKKHRQFDSNPGKRRGGAEVGLEPAGAVEVGHG